MAQPPAVQRMRRQRLVAGMPEANRRAVPHLDNPPPARSARAVIAHAHRIEQEERHALRHQQPRPRSLRLWHTTDVELNNTLNNVTHAPESYSRQTRDAEGPATEGEMKTDERRRRGTRIAQISR